MLEDYSFYDNIRNNMEFKNEIFEFPNINLYIDKDILYGKCIRFNNCTFICNEINFDNIYDDEIMIFFDNCSFESNVTFSNSKFNLLSFKNTKNIKSLRIHKGKSNNKFEVEDFRFLNDIEHFNPKLKTDFFLNNMIVNNSFIFENINHSEGQFNFSENILGKDEMLSKLNIFSFFKSNFSNSFFFKNLFNTDISFKKTSFRYNSEFLKSINSNICHTKFEENIFNKVNFDYSEFENNIEFFKCDFLSTSWFQNCKNIDKTHLKFLACKFEGYALFDNSKINITEILHSKFLQKVSFDNFNTNVLKLHQISFTDAAYFDDLNKNNNKVIENWDRKTLRAIKRELVNTHNQIDYLRFKAYELNAYKKEIDKDKLSWKDSFILYFNESSNYFGLDWTRGLGFIFQWSFVFYLFYIISYSARVESLDCLPKIEDFASNYLKFTNPLSFLNPPLKHSENYFFPLLFLLLGKIFVSYGIYQTIQAFRKFGVNGG